MEEQYDVDKFISLIKSKQSIWNYRCRVYGNKLQRTDDWLAICKDMVEDFHKKTFDEKVAIVSEYRGKWKVLRDGFTRSLKNNRIKNDDSTKLNKGKLYTHYKQLEFLNHLYENDKKILLNGEGSQKERKGKKRPRQCGTETSLGDDILNEPEPKQLQNSDITAISTTESEIDEDKQFMLSLLSDFKRIPADDKLDAKGDIINIIRHYKNRVSYYCNDIAGLSMTETERPESSRGSSYCEYITENSYEGSPIEIKFINT